MINALLMLPNAPYRCIILEPYKISTYLYFIDGGSMGSTPGGPGTLLIQYYFSINLMIYYAVFDTLF